MRRVRVVSGTYSIHALPWQDFGGWQGDFATVDEAIAALPPMSDGMTVSIRDIMGGVIWQMDADGTTWTTQTVLDSPRVTATGHTTITTHARGSTSDTAARARADLAATAANLQRLVAVTEASFAVASTRGDLAAAERARDEAVRAALAEHTGAAIAAATQNTGAALSQQRVSQIGRGVR